VPEFIAFTGISLALVLVQSLPNRIDYTITLMRSCISPPMEIAWFLVR